MAYYIIPHYLTLYQNIRMKKYLFIYLYYGYYFTYYWYYQNYNIYTNVYFFAFSVRT